MRIDQIGLLSFTILSAAITLGWAAEPDLAAGAAANQISNQGLAQPPKAIVVPAPNVDDLTNYGGCSDCAPSRPQTPFEAGAAANRLSNQAPAQPPKAIVVPAPNVDDLTNYGGCSDCAPPSRPKTPLEAGAAANRLSNQAPAQPPKAIVVPAPNVDDLTNYGGCSDCAPPSRPKTPLEAGAAANQLSNQGQAQPPKAIVVPTPKALRAGASKLSISREVALRHGVHGGANDGKLKTMPMVDRSMHVQLPKSRSPAIAKLPDAGRGAARTLVAHPAGLDTLHARSSLPTTAGGNFNAAAKSLQSNTAGSFNTFKSNQLSGGAGSFHAPKTSAMDALSHSNFGSRSVGGSADKFRRPK